MGRQSAPIATGRVGERMSLGRGGGGRRDLPHPSRRTVERTQPAVQWVPAYSQRQSGWIAVLTSAKIKERVQLYLYCPSVSSWTVLGWISLCILENNVVYFMFTLFYSNCRSASSSSRTWWQESVITFYLQDMDARRSNFPFSNKLIFCLTTRVKNLLKFRDGGLMGYILVYPDRRS
jgi:hypothetical protein